MKHKEIKTHKEESMLKFHKSCKKNNEKCGKEFRCEWHWIEQLNTFSGWQGYWYLKKKFTPPVSQSDMLRIYKDMSKLSLVERYLKILYRPYTCTAQTGCQYRLAELNSFLPESSYEPDMHPALLLRFSNPSCSLRMYDNGIMTCQGFSHDSAALGIHRCIEAMEQLGYKPNFHNSCFNVVNATFCLPFGINLIEIGLEYGDISIFTEEAYSYLIFQIENSSIKLAIFSHGFVFVLLSSQMSFTQKAIAYIMPIVFRHRLPGKKGFRYPHADLSTGDVKFKLLWENQFQTTYQDSLKYCKYPNES